MWWEQSLAYNLQVLHVFDLWGQVLEVIIAQVQGAKGFYKQTSGNSKDQLLLRSKLTELEEISRQNILVQVVVRQIQNLKHGKSAETTKIKIYDLITKFFNVTDSCGSLRKKIDSPWQ